MPYLCLVALLCAASMTAKPVGAESKVEAHVPTAVYCCHGYANDTVSPAAAAPYVNWANTDEAGAIADHAGGIRNVVEYIDVARVYKPDRAYPLVTGGKFSAALARTCSGAPITTSPEGFMTDPYKPATRGLLEDEISANYSPEFAAYFVDDIDAFRWGITNGTPCNGNQPWSEPATSHAYAEMLGSVRVDYHGRSVVPRIIMNGLSQYADRPPMWTVPLNTLRASNVIGGMCEGCFGDNTPDTLKRGDEWQGDVELELATVRQKKIYWDYVRYIANDPAARLYTFASFMLAWDPNYTLYQTAYKPNTTGQLHVTPETQLVAHNPRKRDIDSVAKLRDSSGNFVREYENCYFRRQPIGPCAFVVNSDTGSHQAPRLSTDYRHTVAVSGGMVLEGGNVSLQGPPMPSVIPPVSGWILTR